MMPRHHQCLLAALILLVAPPLFGTFAAQSKEGGQCLAFPDVCKTPLPIIGKVPVPYGNITQVVKAKGATKKKVVTGKKKVATKKPANRKPAGKQPAKAESGKKPSPAEMRRVAKLAPTKSQREHAESWLAEIRRSAALLEDGLRRAKASKRQLQRARAMLARVLELEREARLGAKNAKTNEQFYRKLFDVQRALIALPYLRLSNA